MPPQGRLVRGKQTEPDISLTDGSRGFTGPVDGVLPTLADHLVTKAYADSLTGTGLTIERDLVPLVTTGDAASTGLSLALTPAGDVIVLVNNIAYYPGDGDKTKDCYFSADGGVTARSVSALAAGDVLYWNGSTAKAAFDLDAGDLVSFVY